MKKLIKFTAVVFFGFLIILFMAEGSSTNSNRNVDLLSGVIKFDTPMERVKLEQMKQNLAQCTYDYIANDVEQSNLSRSVFSDLIDIAYKWHNYGELRDQFMNQNDTDYVRQINYACLEYHPDKKQVVMDYSYTTVRKQVNDECGSTEYRDFSCAMTINSEAVNEYLEKHGY